MGIAKKFIKYIDSGDLFRTPFKILYMILGAFNIFIPIIAFVVLLNENIFSSEIIIIFAFIIFILILSLASWVGFSIFMDRAKKIDGYSKTDDEFVAIPVIAHAIQTIGEWIGSYIFIVTTLSLAVIIVTIGSIDVRESAVFGFRGMAGLGFVGAYVYSLIIFFGSRLLAETFHAITAIANNTKSMKNNIIS